MNRDDPEQAVLRQRLRENAGPRYRLLCPKNADHGELHLLASGRWYCPSAQHKDGLSVFEDEDVRVALVPA